jgi:hypothetical protein
MNCPRHSLLSTMVLPAPRTTENGCNALKRRGFLRRQNGDIPAILQNLPCIPRNCRERRVGSRLRAQPPSRAISGSLPRRSERAARSPEFRHYWGVFLFNLRPERVTAKERDVFPSLSLVGTWEVTLGEAQLVPRSDVHHSNSFLPGTSMKFRYADESCERDILEIE